MKNDNISVALISTQLLIYEEDRHTATTLRKQRADAGLHIVAVQQFINSIETRLVHNQTLMHHPFTYDLWT